LNCQTIIKESEWTVLTPFEVATLIQELWVEDNSGETMIDILSAGSIHLEGRSRGRKISEAWVCYPHGETVEIVRRVVQSLRGQSEGQVIDALLVAIGEPDTKLILDASSATNHILSEHQRGIYGCMVKDLRGEIQAFISPFHLLATNRTFEAQLQANFAQTGITLDRIRSGELEASWFPVHQFCINLAEKAAISRLLRGYPLVTESDIQEPFVKDLLHHLSDYLIRSVQSDGRMIYMYYPSRGEEDLGRNNAIRQWMATRALIAIAKRSPKLNLESMIRRNIQYNLSTMYREQQEFGWIEDAGKIKLGAIALAALALKEFSAESEFQKMYRRLCNTVRSMWQESGKFRTFLWPAERDDCQNFYPGEALLLWANQLHDQPDDRLMECFSRSFYYYGEWHRRERNPAFVPWHTMAYARLWDRLADQRLVDAIFEMSDWLLGVQQWDEAPWDDCRGRFFAPDRPFGPPHASSTAVYLEGLSEAFRIARVTGDSQRSRAYRIAILRGLRSLAQLTYKGVDDMNFHSKRDSLLGGVRSNEHNNNIRLDNVQHAIMAILGVMAVFDKQDWE